MTVLSYQSIKQLCLDTLMIYPYNEKTVFNGKSYGFSSCGYDVCVAEAHLLAPGAFELGSTAERFNMPKQLVGIVHDKSSWARKGLAVQNTVIEPGWCGYLTLELSNHSSQPIEIAAGDPICQIIFHVLDAITEMPYTGKYQNQSAGPQLAIDE